MPKNDKDFMRLVVDQKNIAKIQNKMVKYPPYAIQQGLEAAADYLNEVKEEIYPPESSAPFEWSSDKQRKAYFASDGFGGGIPSTRTNELSDSGEFSAHSGGQGGPYSMVGYENTAPYSKYVIGVNAIIGHVKRGWKPVSAFVMSRRKTVTDKFKKAVIQAWNEMEKFIYGGGGGL